MADPFATPEELSVYSGGAIAADDPRSEGALAAASAIIRNRCGWHIWPVLTDDVITLDGNRARILSLPTLHVDEVTQVKVDETVIDTSTYTWSTIGELRGSDWYWSEDYRSVEVTLTHGYSDAPELKQLALAMASRAIIAPAGGVVREQTLASSVTWAQTAPGVSGGVVLMAHEYFVLSPYKIETV